MKKFTSFAFGFGGGLVLGTFSLIAFVIVGAFVTIFYYDAPFLDAGPDDTTPSSPSLKCK